MIGNISLSVVAQQYGGLILNGDAVIKSLSIDSRTLKSEQVFAAIKGPNFDGHDFAAKAAEAGISALVVERPSLELKTPQWVVSDCVKALGQIGSCCRDAFRQPVIGITGSSGKTSVKEMLASILRQRGEVLSTKGNFNNHLGVPLMLSELSEEHAFAVLEMGASAVGEIAYLSGLVKPDVALVNNVGTAHLEGFGSRQAIVQGKGEIYQSLTDAGRAVINLDSYGAEDFLQQVSDQNSAQVLTFSATGKAQADVKVSHVRIHDQGADYVLHSPLGDIDISQSVLGLNNVANGAAAATCALAVGMRLDEIRNGLNQVGQVAGRLFSRQGIAGSWVLDDAYNANPESMMGAIEVLANFDGKRIFVMGAMAELGPEAESLHRGIGEKARAAGIEHMICVGEPTKTAASAFGSNALWVESNDQAAQCCRDLLGPKVVVLVKGSRSARLDEVVTQITNLEEPHAVLVN